MNALLTRRHVVAGLGLLSLGLLAGCDPGSGLSYKYGKDLSNEILGRKFKLRDAEGNEPGRVPDRIGPCCANQENDGPGRRSFAGGVHHPGPGTR